MKYGQAIDGLLADLRGTIHTRCVEHTKTCEFDTFSDFEYIASMVSEYHDAERKVSNLYHELSAPIDNM